MKKIICLLLAALFVFCAVSCSDKDPVKEYVDKNGAVIARMMEMGFDDLGSCEVTADGRNIVVSFYLTGVDNASSEFKEMICQAYESLIPQMRQTFEPVKKELPELENMIYNVCEEDGEIMCSVKIDF